MYSEVERRLAKLAADSRADNTGLSGSGGSGGPTGPADPAGLAGLCDALAGRRIGLEREALRVDERGGIATTDHPASLGAALCHPSITTDFSESLVEMVTPPSASAREALATLDGIHRFVAVRLENDEYLWNASMPCILAGEDSIRIGEYGDSHAGTMKKVYRRGLGVRYGRRMQAIAGIHFNFSLPPSAWALRDPVLGTGTEQEITTHGYFHMLQNLVGIGWIVPYLFGASPAICQSFLAPGATTDLESLGGATRYAPTGTSLRMGNIGYRYREDVPIDLSVDHSNMDTWLRDVIGHVTTEHPPYRELGEFDARGERQQLSANRLQIENEYYGTVRPKQIPEAGEMPILALRKRGIRYLELRSVDIDPFEPAGIGLETVATLELLMLFAWLADPLVLCNPTIERTKRNLKTVAHHGRDPDLVLEGPAGNIALLDWARAILEPLEPLARALDANEAEPLYARALAAQLGKLETPDSLPSARVLERVRDAGSFADFTSMISVAHSEELVAAPPSAALEAELAGAVVESFACRDRYEAASKGSFEAHLADYFSQLGPRRVRPGAVILAGGLARRMGGKDKGLESLDGRALVGHVLDAIRPATNQVVINANRNHDGYAAFGVPVVGDGHDGHPGPLAGLAAGIDALDDEYVFMCPCDSPFIDARLIERLVDSIGNHDVACAHDGVRSQPIFALVHRRCRASLEAFLVAGERKIDRWYAEVSTVMVEMPELAEVFVNLNTMDELDAAAGAVVAKDSSVELPA